MRDCENWPDEPIEDCGDEPPDHALEFYAPRMSDDESMRYLESRYLLALIERRDRERQRRWGHEITCGGCGDTATLYGDNWEFVYGQMRLYLRGWRRNPGTQIDYCSSCAPHYVDEPAPIRSP